MTTLNYRPAARGGWLIVADARRAFLVGPSGWELADDAASVIGGDRGFEATIDVVTRAGFASIPDFVLLEWTGDTLRSLLRGPVTLTVTDGAGEHTQDGSGISTWTERSFAGATAVQATIDGAAAVDGVAHLALRSGAAFLASCALDFSDDPLIDGGGQFDDDRRSVRPAVPAPAVVPVESSPAVPQPSAELSDSTMTSIVELPEETSAPIIDTIVTTATPVAGIDALNEATIVRSAPDIVPPPAVDTLAVETPAGVPPAVETPAGVPPAVETSAGGPPAPAASDDRAGDHDGQTILSSDIAKLRSGRKPASQVPEKAAVPAQEKVPAMFLALPDGSRERLDQPVLIGRSPSVSKVSGDRMPRLITIGGGDQDISRNHAQFAVEGGTVVVTDLHSRNGTLVVLPGKSPQKLRAGEPTSVIVGTVVDLGGGITLTVGEE